VNRRMLALALPIAILLAPQAQADSKPPLIRDIRAAAAELKGFGYLEIGTRRWCLVSVDAEIMDATTGQPVGETFFGSDHESVCKVLWHAARNGYRVDLTGVPERAVTERIFMGPLRKVYPVGYVWVRTKPAK
jgi:hypothetical protein